MLKFLFCSLMAEGSGESEYFYFLSVAVKQSESQILLQPTPLLPSRLGNTQVFRAELGVLFFPDCFMVLYFLPEKLVLLIV